MFSYKKEKEVKRPKRVKEILHTLADRYKDRNNHRTIADAIDAAALNLLLSIPEIAGDVPSQLRGRNGENSSNGRANL